MGFITLLTWAALATCLVAPIVILLQFRVKDAATQAKIDAKNLLVKANCELKKNPPRAGRNLYKYGMRAA